jgi:hypothetical protein
VVAIVSTWIPPALQVKLQPMQINSAQPSLATQVVTEHQKAMRLPAGQEQQQQEQPWQQPGPQPVPVDAHGWRLSSKLSQELEAAG